MIRSVIAAIAVLFAVASPAAATPLCPTATELTALQFRQLQIELMVAALDCDGGTFDYRGTYAVFIQHARPGLAENARKLRAMFARNGMDAAAIDRYQTDLATNAELESRSLPDYCGSLASVMADVARLDPAGLTAYAARTYPAPYGANACATPTVRDADARRNPS